MNTEKTPTPETTTPMPAPTPGATAARPPRRDAAAHWYTPAGEPMHRVNKADGKGTTNTTLLHARKLNLVPSVTGILRILHKEALVNWLIEQAALAVITAPRKPNESEDAFVFRVLHTEAQQEQESKIARDRGTEIHEAMQDMFEARTVSAEILPWVKPPFDALCQFGNVLATEAVLVGPGYAGTTDLIMDCGDHWRLWDFKSTKKLPDPRKGGAWPEHKLQLAAYAKAHRLTVKDPKPIIVGNVYISTVNPGEFVVCEHEEPWEETYEYGFAPLVIHWQWANRYRPNQPEMMLPAEPEPAAELTQESAPPTPVAVNVAPPPATPPPPPVPGLPTHSKDGKRLVWTTGTIAPSN